MVGIIRTGKLFSGLGGGSFTVAPPEPEQDTGNQTSSNTTSDTATFASNTTTGNGVIVMFALKGGRRVSTLVDNKGNVYTRVGFVVDVSDAVAEMWYSAGITGGASHTLTVTYDAAAYVVWGAIEVSRIKGGGGFLDARTVATFARAGSGSSASVSVTSGVPRGTNELFVGMLALAGGGADAGIDTPTLWTAITQFNNYDSIMAGHGAYRVNANATALTATWTNDTTTAPAAAIIAAFRATNAISAGVPAPTNSGGANLPAITGTPTEGETLTASTGTWANSPDAYTYQWKDDGVAITGATASTYVLTASEVGATITVTVTATNEGGSASATSAGVGPVAAAAGDPYWNDVVLLLELEGADGATTTTDASASAHTITLNSAPIDTDQARLGSSSSYPNAVGNISVADSADWYFATNPFCIEFSARFETVTACGLVSQYGAGNQAFYLFNDTTDQMLNFQWATADASTVNTNLYNPRVFSANQWYDFAIDCDGTHVRVFVDGDLHAKRPAANFGNSGAALRFGQDADGARVTVDGWIDHVRITKGSSRYGTDLGYTPVESAYPTNFGSQSSPWRTSDYSNLAADDLDYFPAAIYSASRLLYSGYSGSIIRVKRSSDNTEQDIGVDVNGALDTSALSTFVGANNGYIVKFYDQSGHGSDLDVVVTGNITIVSSGTIETVNSKPAALFSSSKIRTTAGARGIFGDPGFTILAGVRPTADSTNTIVADASGDVALFFNAGAIGLFTASATTATVTSTAPAYTAAIATRHDLSNKTVYYNGTPGTSQTTAAIALDADNLYLGGQSGGTAYAGYLTDMIIWRAPTTNADMNQVGGSIATHLGVSWTTIT